MPQFRKPSITYIKRTLRTVSLIGISSCANETHSSFNTSFSCCGLETAREPKLLPSSSLSDHPIKRRRNADIIARRLRCGQREFWFQWWIVSGLERPLSPGNTGQLKSDWFKNSQINTLCWTRAAKKKKNEWKEERRWLGINWCNKWKNVSKVSDCYSVFTLTPTLSETMRSSDNWTLRLI